jgi:hypothetical protein
VSPVLSNILLSRLDSYVETVLIPQYTKGARRASNPEYQHLLKEAAKHRKKGEIEEAEELRRQAQQIPSIDINDPNYRRLRYVRYADDFLLGFNGPKAEAIKKQLRAHLQEELKLELSEEKTLITNARKEAARFLGYEVVVHQENSKRYISPQGVHRRSINDGNSEQVESHHRGGRQEVHGTSSQDTTGGKATARSHLGRCTASMG